jgi:sigma-B regulation protein RsbU (phosphoserine phosphatase)
LGPLGQLAARLARGELEVDPLAPPPQPAPRFPDEAQRLRQATETLRKALHQRVRDLTLIGRTRERLFGEMTFARSMQEAMRPQKLPSAPDLEVAAFVHTASDVCGDMYDYFYQRPRRLCCVMGNAAAHGVPAALLTSRVIPLLHELLLSGFAPGRALENINRVLSPAASREQHMVSVFVGILNLDDGRFRFACAGHAPPFRRQGREADQLEWTGNVPLGIRDEEIYPEREIHLRPGETLFFSGPRLLSVQDAAGRDFGEGALRRFLAENAEAPTSLVRSLYTRLRNHAGGPPRDDLTFFAVRWRGEAAEGKPPPQAASFRASSAGAGQES